MEKRHTVLHFHVFLSLGSRRMLTVPRSRGSNHAAHLSTLLIEADFTERLSVMELVVVWPSKTHLDTCRPTSIHRMFASPIHPMWQLLLHLRYKLHESRSVIY